MSDIPELLEDEAEKLGIDIKRLNDLISKTNEAIMEILEGEKASNAEAEAILLTILGGHYRREIEHVTEGDEEGASAVYNESLSVARFLLWTMRGTEEGDLNITVPYGACCFLTTVALKLLSLSKSDTN